MLPACVLGSPPRVLPAWGLGPSRDDPCLCLCPQHRVDLDFLDEDELDHLFAILACAVIVGHQGVRQVILVNAIVNTIITIILIDR